MNKFLAVLLFITSSLLLSDGSEYEVKSENIEIVEMPNLYGKSVMEAYSILNKKGIKPQLTGNGVIIFQSISAGEKIPKQSICILKAEIKS